MHRIFLALVLAVAVATPGASRGLFATKLTVNPVTAKTFEVIEAYGAGASQMWCAAARYAQERLGKDRGRIYLAEALGPAKTAPGKKGAVFSIDPVPGGRSGGSVSVSEPGYNLLVNHAIQFCRDLDYDLDAR